MTAAEFVELQPGEIVIEDDSDPSELLFRQICAHIWDTQHNKPDLHSFGPQSADERKPSFSRESVVSAQQSRDWHNENAKSKSKGVWACSIAEVHAAGTRAIDDSATPKADGEIRAPGHAFIDYRHTNKGELKAIKAKLLMAALEREECPTVDNSQPAAVETDETESESVDETRTADISG